MKSKIIYADNYYDGLFSIIDLMNSHKPDIKIRRLLIVPERYTLLAEKYVYSKCEGSFDIEVLSLSRLFYKMGISAPLLSKEGAIMLLRSIVKNVSLSCFFRSAQSRGFCEKAYDAINDFLAAGIMPCDIVESTPKLKDLKLLYQKYLEAVDGKFVDQSGKLALIRSEAANSDYIKNANIFVANFDYYDVATMNTLKALGDAAISLTILEVNGESEECRPVVCDKDGAEAIKEVASRLRYLASKGVGYKDMAVIMGNADYDKVGRIFREYEIPAFLAQNKELIDMPCIDYMITAVECALHRKRENVIKLSKSVFSGLDVSDADRFENYINARLIDYDGFSDRFDSCEDVRKKLVDDIVKLEERIKKVHTVDDFCDFIQDLDGLLDIRNKCAELSISDAAIDKAQSLTPLMKQASLDGNFEFLFSVWQEGLKATKVAPLPCGGVTVGDPAAMRGGKFAFMAVIGFDNGFLPKVYDDSSLIGEEEKKTLPDGLQRAEQINFRYQRELSMALASAKMVFVTASDRSYYLQALNCVAADDSCDNYEQIVMRAGSKTHAPEFKSRLWYRHNFQGEDYGNVLASLSAAGVHRDAKNDKRTKFLSRAGELFFRTSTSVSELQSYFRCPFAHFADYGLRLKDKEDGEMNPVDVGQFLHSLIENVLKNDGDCSLEQKIDDEAAKIIQGFGKATIENNADTISALIREAKQSIRIFVDHINKGKFKPLGEEISFSSNINGVNFVGKIDYADVYENHIRLIDYKTGNASFSFADVYCGKSVQLPLYMKVQKDRGYRAGAMLLYPYKYKWESTPKDNMFSGVVLNDEVIVNAMDCSGEVSDVYNFPDKRTKSRGSGGLISYEQMDELLTYVTELSSLAVSEIKEGYVYPSPYKGSCKDCKYAPICGDKTERTSLGAKKENVCKGREESDG